MTTQLPVKLIPPSRLDHHLERLSIGHGAIAVRGAVEVDGVVEDATRLDLSVEDVRQELVDVGADRCRTAADRDVSEERRKRGRDRLICGTPTRPIAPPGRATPIAVSIDWSRPMHSRTECAPVPPVSSRALSTASSPRWGTTSVAPNSSAREVRASWRPRMMICSARSPRHTVPLERATSARPDPRTCRPPPRPSPCRPDHH